LPAERIADVIVRALTVQSPKTRYQIAPDPLQNLAVALLPKRMIDRIVARRLGLTPTV
jgi:hypothetical protein